MSVNICVVTGTRAEYFLLREIIRILADHDFFSLSLVVTGSHLSNAHGHTVDEIIADGIRIDEKLPILNDLDSPLDIGAASARAIEGLSNTFAKLQPDLVLVLGDRYEILSAAIAAQFQRIPVGHIHGGETTEGAMDEAFRHSITKLSHLHFVATDVYKKRVIQLGEHPDRVFIVGGLGVDLISQTKIESPSNLEKHLKLKFQARNLLITFHPATLEELSPASQVLEVLAGLEGLNETTLIFTMPNADIGNNAIREAISDFVIRNKNAYSYESLGAEYYLSLLSKVDAVIGNSSSGITEAPTLRTPTINIGTRQRGRLRAKSVIDCQPDRKSIMEAINRLYSAEFQKSLETVVNPYGNPGASKKILSIIQELDLKEFRVKKFFDL